MRMPSMRLGQDTYRLAGSIKDCEYCGIKVQRLQKSYAAA